MYVGWTAWLVSCFLKKIIKCGIDGVRAVIQSVTFENVCTPISLSIDPRTREEKFWTITCFRISFRTSPIQALLRARISTLCANNEGNGKCNGVVLSMMRYCALLSCTGMIKLKP
jgi:hypothetical protein